MFRFTKENAAAFGRKGAATTNQRHLQRSELPPAPQIADDEPATVQTKLQLARLDQEINRALDRRDWDAMPVLTAAKERLWKLVRPTAGSHKPGRRGVQQPRQIMPLTPIGTYQGAHEADAQ